MSTTTLPAFPTTGRVDVNHLVHGDVSARYRPGSGIPVRTVCGRLVWPTVEALDRPSCRDCEAVHG